METPLVLFVLGAVDRDFIPKPYSLLRRAR
jgi:hypothetical protein